MVVTTVMPNINIGTKVPDTLTKVQGVKTTTSESPVDLVALFQDRYNQFLDTKHADKRFNQFLARDEQRLKITLRLLRDMQEIDCCLWTPHSINRTFDQMADSRYYDVCLNWFDEVFDREERALMDNVHMMHDMIQLSIGFWDVSSLTDSQIISIFADLLLVFVVDDYHEQLTAFTIKVIRSNQYEQTDANTVPERVTLKLLRELQRHSAKETFEYSKSYFFEWLHMSEFEESICRIPTNSADVYYRGRTSWAGACTIYVTAFTTEQIKEWVDHNMRHPEFSDMVTHQGTFIGILNDVFSRKKEMHEAINMNAYRVVDNDEDVYNYLLSRVKHLARLCQSLDPASVQRFSDCLMGGIVWHTICLRYSHLEVQGRGYWQTSLAREGIDYTLGG
ncbi:hypothetical protein SAMD00019534_013500 [Acytostelium subglobosum LB1]|uniref:hypothetical protein n=1 Tax=Acytostelium subglobosum LB1 TaxID=1410327 RepID=UPI000644EDD9|nr:hypothetical protein SAMD00019534_013500 [Acytostelium subglobosum LB1]GAM18175.1 hypothetical protein SAMD00019534_013500 [Acytostelium subglobosum LB1]|eukprot:XP_012758771.1 hypothetical protein SAMD00019534_013500 [Acytostelium subglobosum LB1]